MRPGREEGARARAIAKPRCPSRGMHQPPKGKHVHNLGAANTARGLCKSPARRWQRAGRQRSDPLEQTHGGCCNKRDPATGRHHAATRHSAHDQCAIRGASEYGSSFRILHLHLPPLYPHTVHGTEGSCLVVLLGLLNLHLPPVHPRAVHSTEGSFRLFRERETDESKPFAPACILVEGHFCARDAAIL